MARRDASAGLTFELVPDDDADEPWSASAVAVRAGAGPAEASDDDGFPPEAIAPSLLTRATRRVLGWLHGRTPLQLVAGAVALAIAVGGGGTVVILRDRAQVDRLRAAAGGVIDLSHPIREWWSSTLGAGNPGMGAWPLAVLDGGVVVVKEQITNGSAALAARDGRRVRTVLHGLDVDSGDDLWQVTLDGEAPQCGTGFTDLAQTRLELTATSRLVCVVGTGAEAKVVVVDPQGQATRRAPEGLDDRTRLLPGPDGTLLRVDWTGAAPGGLRMIEDASTGWRLSESFRPPDAQVTSEDAATGARRWETTLQAGPVDRVDDWWTCATWNDDGKPVFDMSGITSVVTEAGLHMQLCGVEAVLTATGDIVAQHRTGEARNAQVVVQSLADGGLGVVADPSTGGWYGQWTQPTEVVDTSGREVAQLSGGVLDPWATDGTGGIDLTGDPSRRASDDGVLITHDTSHLIGVGADGTQLWRVADRPVSEGAIARGAGVVVLVRRALSGYGELVAVDLRTGATRWTVELDRAGGLGGGAWEFARGAWTDGEVAVLVTPGNVGDSLPATWTAYNLRTGAVVWQLNGDQAGKVTPPDGLCLAVVGRLLCSDGSKLVRVA
ncbi:hypothetical protein [Xylanimonas sp. McL0601]|uniref:hypothetical protein n=1 Tax=Xylanimonas sp. McL0601 TaxID=3414739 RepID=UPI003CEAFC94